MPLYIRDYDIITYLQTVNNRRKLDNDYIIIKEIWKIFINFYLV